MFAIFDALGNYRRWVIFGSNSDLLQSTAPSEPFVIDPSYTATMQGQSATPPDLTQIVALEFHAQANSTASLELRVARINTCSKVEGVVLTAGEVGNPGNLQTLITHQETGTQLWFLRKLSSRTISLAVPLSPKCAYGELLDSTLQFEPIANFTSSPRDVKCHCDPPGINVDLPAGGVFRTINSQIKSTNRFPYSSTFGAGATALTQNSLLISQAARTLRAGGTLDGVTISTFDQITIDGSQLTDCIFSGGTSNPSVIINSLGTNRSMVFLSLAGAIRINLPAGDYSTWNASLPAGLTVTLAGGGGAYNFSGLRSSGTITFNAIDGGNYTITVAQNGITAAAASPSTSGTVTIVQPVSQISFVGLPTVSNTRLLVKNLTAGTQAFYTVTGGAIDVVTTPTSTYEVRADAPGYLASDFVELPGNTPQYRFSLVNRRDIYDAGTTRFDRVIFNPSTFVVQITDGPALSPEDVFRTIEDYLVLEDSGVVMGLLYTAHPIPVTIPGRFILRFVYDAINDALNPARIKPHPDNLTDPELLFEVELEGADDPTWDLFDFSEAGGRIIRVRSQVAIANVTVSGGGGGSGEADWTTAERNQIRHRLGIDGTTATPSATPNLGNVTVGGYATGQSPAVLVTGFATPANIAAAQTAIINQGNSAWATATGFSTLTAAQVWAHGTKELTALPALPTNWITAAAIATDAVTKLATGIEAAMLNDGDGQALIDAIVTFVNANLDLPALELAAIADSVWARLTSIGPPDGSYGALLISRLNATISSRLAAEDYTAPNNAAIAAILEDTGTTLPGLIGALPPPLDATATQTAAAAAIAAWPVAKPADVAVTVNPTPVTVNPTPVTVEVDGGFSPESAADLVAARQAAEAVENYTRPGAKQLGLVEGVTATHSPEGITVSDGDGSTTIVDNLDGSYTVSKAP